MDFDQLHTFLEIVRLKSFSKAAQTCYRTQPAISAQVRQLEQELRTALFERFGSRITLTTAGKIFSGYYVLPEVFAEYKGLFPAVQLLVDRSYGSRVVEAVMENIADFGLTQLPVEEKRLQVVNVHRDEIRLIVPAKHPLAAKNAVTCQDLVDYQMLLPKSGVTRTRLNAWFEMVEDSIQISMELDSTEMMKRFVMAGLGVSFLAVSNCQEEIAAGKLKAIALGPEPMVRRLGLIYRRDKALSKAALGFIQIILDNMGEHRTAESKKLPKLATG